jgi:ATP-dependent DNA ligase
MAFKAFLRAKLAHNRVWAGSSIGEFALYRVSSSVRRRRASNPVGRGGCASSAVHSSAAVPIDRDASLGPRWVHEIKLDGFRMAPRINNGRVQLLTRTGLDWRASRRSPG